MPLKNKSKMTNVFIIYFIKYLAFSFNFKLKR
jgi:hypothetical protein